MCTIVCELYSIHNERWRNVTVPVSSRGSREPVDQKYRGLSTSVSSLSRSIILRRNLNSRRYFHVDSYVQIENQQDKALSSSYKNVRILFLDLSDRSTFKAHPPLPPPRFVDLTK